MRKIPIKLLQEKHTQIKDEQFCIGLKSNGFPINSYLIFPPQLSSDLLKSLLGQDGAKNDEIIEFIKIIMEK